VVRAGDDPIVAGDELAGFAVRVEARAGLHDDVEAGQPCPPAERQCPLYRPGRTADGEVGILIRSILVLASDVAPREDGRAPPPPQHAHSPTVSDGPALTRGIQVADGPPGPQEEAVPLRRCPEHDPLRPRPLRLAAGQRVLRGGRAGVVRADRQGESRSRPRDVRVGAADESGVASEMTAHSALRAGANFFISAPAFRQAAALARTAHRGTRPTSSQTFVTTSSRVTAAFQRATNWFRGSVLSLLVMAAQSSC